MDGNKAPLWIDIEKDPVGTNTPAQRWEKARVVKLYDITGSGPLLHLMEGGEQAPAIGSGQPVKIFSGGTCQLEFPAHGRTRPA